MGAWRQWVSIVWLPSGFCLLAAVLLARYLPREVASFAWLDLVRGLLLLASAWVAWRLHRSRIVLLAVLFGLVSLVQRLGANDSAALLRAVELLVPINLALISLSRDRGCGHPIIFGWLGFIGAEFLALESFLQPLPTSDAFRVWVARACEAAPCDALAGCPPSLVWSSCAVVVCLRLAWRRSAVEAGFVWMLVAWGLEMHAVRTGAAVGFYFTVACAILFLSTIEYGHFLAYRDELTGLLSRRALEERLSSLGGRYAIAMVDIDRFKRFNDRHGHDAGDQLLRMVASLISSTGGGAVAYRYGGEEFALVFSGRGADEVESICDTLRKAIARKRFTLRHWTRPRRKPTQAMRRPRGRKNVEISVSIGLAERCEQAPSVREVLKRADRALYRAKRAGRNRVVVA